MIFRSVFPGRKIGFGSCVKKFRVEENILKTERVNIKVMILTKNASFLKEILVKHPKK